MTTETEYYEDENEAEAVEEAAPRRRGAKPLPLTAAAKRYEKAQQKADKARAAHEKVVSVLDRLHAAEKEEAEALEAFEEELSKVQGDVLAADAE